MLEVCETPLQLLQYFTHASALDPMCTLTLVTQSEPTSVAPIFYFELFLLTIVLEAAFYFTALRGRSPTTKITALFTANLATHPIVCFAFPWMFAHFSLSRASELATAETFAPLIESLLLIFIWKIPKLKAFGYMIAANLFSWWFGLILYSYFGEWLFS